MRYGVTDSVVAAAKAAQAQAYAPYSKFRVGAALEAKDGRVFTGCNVENASFGLTICAERMAFGAAIVAGEQQFRRVVVVSDSTPAAMPCGACRQFMAEFGVDLVVETHGPAGSDRTTLGTLLPRHFGPESLQ
jgi:cytidine deaminase